MKASAEKSATLASTTATRTASQPFFAKAGASSFFEPATRTAAPAVQLKMQINQPGDAFEQEADRMADRVVRAPMPLVKDPWRPTGPTSLLLNEPRFPKTTLPTSPVQRAELPDEKRPMATPAVQRQSSTSAPTVGAGVQAAIRQQTTGGQPLAADVRSYMEPRFGADFSQVRVHHDAAAAGLSAQLSARAFTHQNHVFFSPGQYQPGTSEGRHLLAHELTHTIQQGHAIQRRPQVAATATAPPIQRLGLRDLPGVGSVLDYFAEVAYLIPGFRLLTLVVGFNPITQQATDRSAANLLRALIELMPAGFVVAQALDNHGVFTKAGAWVEQRLAAFRGIGGSLVAGLRALLSGNPLSLLNPGALWAQARQLLAAPVGQLISFAGSVVSDLLHLVKTAILKPLAALAEGTAGYDLLKALLGEDPVTGEPVPRTADTLLGGFMKLIGQEEIWQNLKKGNAVPRAWAWFQGALSGLLGFARSIPQRVGATLASLTFQEVLTVAGAFARVVGNLAGIAGEFMSWGLQQVISLLEILFSVVAPGAIPYIKKAQGAFQTILRNPIGFVNNLVQAGKLGFIRFAGNIAGHLMKGLLAWLTAPMARAGIYVLKSFSLPEILKMVASALGLTWANIRKKLLKIIPEPVLVALEKTASILVTFVQQGPAAALEQIKGELTGLKDQLISQVIEMVTSQVVQAAVTKLVSLLNPAGAVIQAILAIYNTISVFINQLSQIGAVVAAFIDSIAAIAAGQLEGAAKKVEQTMAGLLPIVIAFFAKFAGAGSIPDKLFGLVMKGQKFVDKGIDKVVAWLGGLLKKLGSAIAQAGLPQDPKARLRLGLAAAAKIVNRFAGRYVEKDTLLPLLTIIKTRYGFQQLSVVATRAKWIVKGTINPTDELGTDARAGDATTEADAPRETSQQLRYYTVPGTITPETTQIQKIAEGNLRIMPASQRLRDKNAQNRVSGGTGDDAGHLIGNLFGGSGGEENLSPQNFIQNEYGSFRQLEKSWHNQLLDGATIWVKVTDVFRAGEDRHYVRYVEWRVGGETHKLSFVNTQTPKSRTKRNIPATVSGEQSNNVINVDFRNRNR